MLKWPSTSVTSRLKSEKSVTILIFFFINILFDLNMKGKAQVDRSKYAP